MDLRLAVRLIAAAIAAAALLPAAAAGASTQTVPAPAPPKYLPETPPGYEITARKAARIAASAPEVEEHAPSRGRLTTAIEVDDNYAWQVGFKDRDGTEVVQVIVDGRFGGIRAVWTGDQVAWPMARGYEGQFGHVLNAPWVWLPLSAVFLAFLVEWRRPWRIVHLDLLVLLSFGVSHVFFNRGEIGVSVPLVYPVLAYLLARMLWLGFRGGGGLRPSAPALWIAIAAIFLLAFRVTINVADSGVIDVGYAGTVGADRITHGEPIYGDNAFPEDNPFGDTYGPATYFAYVPFEIALPWSGEWDQLPASHAAAIAFDLATVAGLLLFGIRLRPGREGRELGILLAFAWLAYPYTAFALQSNSNDSLVAALIVWSLALFARPVARAALLAVAAAAKFAPLALAPLYAAGERGLAETTTGGERRHGLRRAAGFSAAFTAVIALMLVQPAIDPGLATFWDRTAASQLDRSSPFSIWGQVDGIEGLQKVVLGLSVVLGILVAFLPRRRSIAQIAALASAVLIAFQLGVDHWFYLYIPWFAGPLFIALATINPAPVRAPAR